VLINLRGSSGSGKSTVVRALLDRYGSRSIYGCLGLRAPEAYRLDDRAFVIGPYLTPCGGCDALGSMDRVIELLREYSAKGHHVIFEGLLISSMYGSVGQFLERYGRDALVAFLTTSRQRAYQQLCKRQSEGRARGSESFDRHYDGTQRVKERMLRDGRLRVEELEPDNAVAQISAWLMERSNK
jgi:hypothetical protein